MQGAVVGAIIGIVGTLVVGLILTRLNLLWQRQRRVVGYETTSLRLETFKRGVPKALMLQVHRFIITGAPEDENQYTPIDKATLYQVRLTNIGTEHLPEPKVEITLENGATIVTWETDPPESPAYQITATRDPQRRNALHVVPAYLNRRDVLRIWLTAIDNQTRYCAVKVHGLGIETVIHPSRVNTLPRKPLVAIFTFMAISQAIIAFFALAPLDLAAAALGTTVGTQQVARIAFHWWVGWVVVAWVVAWLGITMYGARMAYLTLKQKATLDEDRH
jgi:hypothetical protein